PQANRDETIMIASENQHIERTIAADAAAVSYNQRAHALVAEALARGEVKLSEHGAVVATTGIFTGRSPKDKFIVRDDNTRNLVWWDNAGALTPEQFDRLYEDFLAGFKGKSLYAQQLLAGAEARHRFQVDVITDSAWHALFIRNLLIRPEE